MTGPERARTRIGLKLWSPNIAVARKAEGLHLEGLIDLIELYVVPGSIDDTLPAWKSLTVPYMIHCPHAAHEFNLSKADAAEGNAAKFVEVQAFADALRADVIVVHGGFGGNIDQTIRQLRGLNDRRILLENKPKVGLNGAICIGHSPEEVSRIVAEAALAGIVLDFGHATCAANSSGVSPFAHIARFLEMEPKVFHIGDGDASSAQDVHLNFGAGSFDIPRLLSCVPVDACLTIETPTDLALELTDFAANARYLRSALKAERAR